jgi:molybdopterin molybdotransferase
VLAEDLVSALQVPPQDNSSMDGYAVRRAEIADEGVLPVSQRIPAGQAAQPLQPGTAARIFTGAPVPPGADAIVMQEDTEPPARAWCASCACPTPASGSAAAARTSLRGSVVLQRGQRLDPGACGLAAGIGRDRCRSRAVRGWRCSPPATNW